MGGGVAPEIFTSHIFTAGIFPLAFYLQSHPRYAVTLQPLYNTVRYNTVLDITRHKDGSQKCIDYIEK